MSSGSDWLKPWKTVDLLLVCKAIAGSEDIYSHPVKKEWEYQVEKRSKGNDRGNLEWVGANKKTPLINAYLLANGFTENEMVIFWVCW